MTNSERYSESVRIVQIDTHFVETDAANFRAVVQSLTGKNSSTISGANGPSSSSSLLSLVAAAAETGSEAKGGGSCFHGGVVDAVKLPSDDQDKMVNNMIIGGSKYEDDDFVLSSMKVNHLSFEDFDWLLSQFALREELPLWQ